MKVTRNTNDQLIVEDTPWFLGFALAVFTMCFMAIGVFTAVEGEMAGLILGAFGGGMGLLAMAVFIQRLQVIFDRLDGKVTFRRRNWRGYREVTHDLMHVEGAVIETTRSDNNTLYRTSLLLTGGMSQGTHPLREAYTSGNAAEKVAEEINVWLGNEQSLALDSGRRQV